MLYVNEKKGFILMVIIIIQHASIVSSKDSGLKDDG